MQPHMVAYAQSLPGTIDVVELTPPILTLATSLPKCTLVQQQVQGVQAYQLCYFASKNPYPVLQGIP